ncbi:MAG: hypothetical protein ACP5UC_01325 [Candidatus Micrarchaeia archaeon]
MKMQNPPSKAFSFLLAAILLFAFLSNMPFANIPTTTILPSPQPSSSSGPCSNLPSSIQENVQANAPWYCPIDAEIASVWQQYSPIAVIALLISFSIASIIFAVGAGMKYDRLRNFGIGELYEATASSIIVLIFLFISAVAFGIIPSFFVGAINPYATAFHLMNETIVGAESIYSSLFNIYATDAFYTSFTVSIYSALYPALTGTVPTLLQSFYAPIMLFVMEPANAIGGLLIDGIAALFAQYYLLIFFASASIPAFLVPGVILRALFPTRAFGGMLIALAMGFYIVMPTLFAVVYYFTTPNLISSMQTISSQLTVLGSGTGAETNGLSSTSPIPLLISSVGSAMSSFWMLVLFYPPLIIAVTYFFVTQVSDFIGGASYSVGRLRSFI